MYYVPSRWRRRESSTNISFAFCWKPRYCELITRFLGLDRWKSHNRQTRKLFLTWWEHDLCYWLVRILLPNVRFYWKRDWWRSRYSSNIHHPWRPHLTNTNIFRRKPTSCPRVNNARGLKSKCAVRLAFSAQCSGCSTSLKPVTALESVEDEYVRWEIARLYRKLLIILSQLFLVSL